MDIVNLMQKKGCILKPSIWQVFDIKIFGSFTHQSSADDQSQANYRIIQIQHSYPK